MRRWRKNFPPGGPPQQHMTSWVWVNTGIIRYFEKRRDFACSICVFTSIFFKKNSEIAYISGKMWKGTSTFCWFWLFWISWLLPTFYFMLFSCFTILILSLTSENASLPSRFCILRTSVLSQGFTLFSRSKFGDRQISIFCQNLEEINFWREMRATFCWIWLFWISFLYWREVLCTETTQTCEL